jgi:hypothetical protein
MFTLKILREKFQKDLKKTYNLTNLFSPYATSAKTILQWKSWFRQRFQNLYHYKYGGFTYDPNNSLSRYMYSKYINVSTSMFNSESRMQELFEMSDKSKYVAAHLVNLDCAELIAIDNYKENFPYTVINYLKNLELLCSLS